MNPEIIYKALGLQDPKIFKEKSKDLMASEITLKQISDFLNENLNGQGSWRIQDFLLERQTGKTTNIIVNAISDAFEGKQTIIITFNYGMKKRLEWILESYLRTLGTIFQLEPFFEKRIKVITSDDATSLLGLSQDIKIVKDLF